MGHSLKSLSSQFNVGTTDLHLPNLSLSKINSAICTGTLVNSNFKKYNNNNNNNSCIQHWDTGKEQFKKYNNNNNNCIQRRNSRFIVQSPHCASNCLQHVRSSGQGAVVLKARATIRVTCNEEGRGSSAMKFDKSLNRV